jgi:20S proteasome alpha/beta subunit
MALNFRQMKLYPNFQTLSTLLPILDVIQKGYSADMSVEQALQLSNKAIEKALGEGPLVETGVVTAKDGSFKKLVNN